MQKFIALFVFFLSFLLIYKNILANETWILDEELSTINFELPILFSKNAKGSFKKIKGVIQTDLTTKKNKAIFSVNFKNIEMNYKKYRPLLFSKTFLDVDKFPIAIIDSKKFSYKNQKQLNLEVELTIKNITNKIPLKLEIYKLAEELIQIKGKLIFSRNEFQIGIGKWSSTTILKDNITIETNLFLFKK